ncbi:MAG: ABC transporter ATP-binding protein [Clostridium sp.]|jgi:ABC-2 type transport system ATP-binding protein|nr:ABC transporter ATP-binding protein [Clostridium sp.]
MIEIVNVSKQFNRFWALNHVSVSIQDGQVFGLIGTNGAGKSTLMRIVSGIYRADTGLVTIDGEPVYENPPVKSNIFYIPDEPYYKNNDTPLELLRFYRTYYPAFDEKRFLSLLETVKLGGHRKIGTFSKGMKRQLSILYGVCAGTKYLLCDETFDGLDPVMRQAVKNLFIREIDSRKMTPIIASHNLRELEDICDHVGLLHQGGVLLSKDLDEMKLGIHRLQCVFKQEEDLRELEKSMPVLNKDRRGTLYTLTIRGERESILTAMSSLMPVFWELLPLTLEEIFISETEVQGYDFKKFFAS